MIECIVEARCVGCNACVEVCPTNVFEASTGAPPVIARVDDCQTCFICELYCPVDAIFVGPDCEAVEGRAASEVEASGLLGQYRRDSGWGEWSGNPAHTNEHWRMEQIFARARSAAAGPK